jgi:hypothetical protein
MTNEQAMGKMPEKENYKSIPDSILCIKVYSPIKEENSKHNGQSYKIMN